MKIYGVVNIDIVNSRNICNRIDIQDKLCDYIECINDKYYSILPAPIDFTLGDEWQLITSEPCLCYDIIYEFQQLLWPYNIKLYAGIGIGTLSTKVYESTHKMDGTCFIMARQAIDIAKQKSNTKEKLMLMHSKNNRIFFKNYEDASYNKLYKSVNLNDKSLDYDYQEAAITSINGEELELPNFSDVINCIIENNEILKEKMTLKQKETYMSYRKLGSYRKMIKFDSKYSNDSASGISQRLNNANYSTIEHNHRMVKSLIYNYCSLKEVL